MALWDDVCNELLADPAVQKGMLFGHRGVKLERKVFAFEFHDDLVVKLGSERAGALTAAGEATLFDPMGGRPMRAWAQLPHPANGDPLRAWVALAEEAKALVAGLV